MKMTFRHLKLWKGMLQDQKIFWHFNAFYRQNVLSGEKMLLNRFFCYKALNGERKSRPQDSPTTAAWFFLAQCHILTKRLPILDVCLFSFTKDHLFRALPTFIIPSTELKPSALFENIDLFLLSTSKPLRLNHISTHFPQLNFIT